MTSAMPSIDSPLLEAATTALGMLIFILVWVLYRFIKVNNTNLVLPPGPRPWPVLGNLHLLGNLPHQSLAGLAKKYGPIMFLRLGSVPTVVVSSPAMVKEIFKTQDSNFSNRPKSSAGKYMAYDSNDILFSSYGAHWRQMRKLCTIELLTAKRIESFKAMREEEVSATMRSICEESGGGECFVNLRQSLASLLQNIICRMFAGRTYSAGDLSGGQSVKEMINEMFDLGGAFYVGDFIPSLDCLDLQGFHRRMKKIHRVFDAFAEKVVDEHIDRRKKNNLEQLAKDLVDVLLDNAEAEDTTEPKITRVYIKTIILDILTAGIDTSSTTIEWAMSELLKNPPTLARAQEEIESMVGRHRLVKESDVANLKYLKCIVKETLRLHPPGPLLAPHESSEACRVSNHYIPPKTRLIVNAWAIGRDESVWKDALEFKPERFIGKNMDVRGQDFELIPFGTGRRACPAISLALHVVELAVAQLVHCFTWSIAGEPSKLSMEESFGLTVPRKCPLFALPKWRLSPLE